MRENRKVIGLFVRENNKVNLFVPLEPKIVVQVGQII